MTGKTYTITEYGSFSRGIVAPGCISLPENTFDKLERFVLENSTKSSTPIELMSLSLRKHIGKVITAKNHVGVVVIDDGTVIEILPKIYGETNETESKQLFLRMLATLQNTPFKSMQSTSLHTDKLPIFEVFIQMFIAEAYRVVKRGLKSGYETVEDNLHVCKGKIDFTKQIRENFVHKERFYMCYDLFNHNQPENRLVRSTLQYLLRRSCSSQNRSDLKVLLNIFEQIPESYDIQRDFSCCTNDRQSQHYQLLLSWCKVFLDGKSFSSFTGSKVAYALLFPMEKLFENYVAKQLKRQLSCSHYTVSSQHTGKYLFDTPKKFSLRPDIVITDSANEPVYIMDTKWKVLTDDPQKNYGISQADMYQMYAYQKKYGSTVNCVTLLYPMTEHLAKKNIRFLSDDGVCVHIFFIDLLHIDNLSRELQALLGF